MVYQHWNTTEHDAGKVQNRIPKPRPSAKYTRHEPKAKKNLPGLAHFPRVLARRTDGRIQGREMVGDPDFGFYFGLSDAEVSEMIQSLTAS